MEAGVGWIDAYDMLTVTAVSCVSNRHGVNGAVFNKRKRRLCAVLEQNCLFLNLLVSSKSQSNKASF